MGTTKTLNGFENRFEKIYGEEFDDKVNFDLVANLVEGKFKIPYDWQEELADFFLLKNFGILNANTGSGKSIAMLLFAYRYLIENPDKFVVIIVPQRMIAKGFEKAYINIDGKNEFISPKLILSGDESNTVDKSNVSEKLYKNLTKRFNNSTNIGDKILIASHVSYVNLFRKLSDVDRNKKIFKRGVDSVLKNVCLFVDEAHHAGTDEFIDENDNLQRIPNGLAEAIEYMVKKNYRTYLTTATFFRGDGCSLLSEKAMEKFNDGYFSLPFYRYIGEICQYLKSISNKWSFFGPDGYYDSIRGEFKEFPHAKTAICIPRTGTRLSGIPRNSENIKAEKNKEVLKVIQSISPRAVVKKINGINCYKIRCQGKDLFIADLVTTNGREKVMDLIVKENEKDNPIIDVIISMDVFKEGADFKCLERVLIVGARGSIVNIMQYSGRAFRDFVGKTKATICTILPDITFNNYTDEELKDVLNHNLKVIVFSMVMEEVLSLNHKKIDCKKKDDSSTGISSEYTNIWMDCFGPDYSKERTELLMKLYLESPISLKGVDLQEAQREIGYSYLKGKGIDDKDTQKQLYNLALRTMENTTKRFSGFDIEDMNVSLVEIDALAGVNKFISQSMGYKDYQSFRAKAVGKLKFDILYDDKHDFFVRRYKEMKLSGFIPDEKNYMKWFSFEPNNGNEYDDKIEIYWANRLKNGEPEEKLKLLGLFSQDCIA